MLDVQRIQLDVSKQPTPQQVRLGQGDANATRLIIDVFDDGTAYSLSGYSVRLEMRLPDSDSYYSTNGTSSGNTATFDIDETYAATSYGFNGFGYVDILDGDTVICSTSRFQLVVLRNAQDGADPSTAYSNGIIEATERAIAAAEAAEGVILQDVPTMSEYIKGGAKLGEGLTVEDETLSLEGESYTAAEKTKLAGIEDNANNYTLPTMGASTKGGAKLGSGLTVQNDVLSLGSHEHSADDITSGVLPIAHGGTGSDTAAGALSALGAVAKSGDTVTGTLNLTGGVQVASRASYPLYVYSSKPAQTSLPSTPCFVLDTSDGGLYYNDGAYTRLNAADSGWQTLTLSSGVETYSTGEEPKYRKVGDIVYLRGQVKPKAEVAANGTVDIGTLPSGFRPALEYMQICQGSGMNVWNLRVFSGGIVRAERYRAGNTAAAMSTTTWLPFSISFMVN